MKTNTNREQAEVDAGERRDLVGRWLRGTGWTLIWLGALTLGFAVHQVWITSWFSTQNQGALGVERIEYFASAEVAEVVVDSTGGTLVPIDEVPDVTQPPADPPPDVVDPITMTLEAAPEEHTAFALIRIPLIERLADGWNVVEGVSIDDLKNGAGHMPATPLPGQVGNAVISGHRTTYGAPFHELDLLQPGDRIEVETAIGLHVYAVRSTQVVLPTDVWVTEPRDGAWLTLTTCHPKFSARERLVVFAELIEGPNIEAARALS